MGKGEGARDIGNRWKREGRIKQQRGKKTNAGIKERRKIGKQEGIKKERRGMEERRQEKEEKEEKEDRKEERIGRGRWTQNSNFESLSVKMRVGLPFTRLTKGRLGSALSH